MYRHTPNDELCKACKKDQNYSWPIRFDITYSERDEEEIQNRTYRDMIINNL